MHPEKIKLIEYFDANPHTDPYEDIKEIRGWKLLIGWRHESKVNPNDILNVFEKEIEIM